MKPQTRRLNMRDVGFLEWAAEQYAVPIDVMAHWYGAGRSWTYEIAERLDELGQVKRVYVTEHGTKSVQQLQAAADRGEKPPRLVWGSMWIVPTRATAHTYLGYDPGPWMVRAGSAEHTRALTELRLGLVGAEVDPARWRSERQLRRDAAARRRLGEQSPYCHDGLYLDSKGTAWAVEAELSAKMGRGRMEAVLLRSVTAARALSETLAAEQVSGVIYFCRGKRVLNRVTSARDNLAAEHGPAAVRGVHIRDLDAFVSAKKAA